jgi:predicted unusual protein kinase regulating ubiquinone biosynthesis (AarF/ABC1/UbiB family)
LAKITIDTTLSQLLVTGVLHTDPHAGNLFKVRHDDGSITLGYLDFGLLLTKPEGV